MSTSACRSWLRFLITGHAPAAHSTPEAGAPGAIPLAWRHASTQRWAMAAKSLISSSIIATRLLMGSFTHASLCACRVSMALSIASWLDGGILPVTVGNWGEPLRVAILMVLYLHVQCEKIVLALTCHGTTMRNSTRRTC